MPKRKPKPRAWSNLAKSEKLGYPALQASDIKRKGCIPLSEKERIFYGNIISDDLAWRYDKKTGQHEPNVSYIDQQYWLFHQETWFDFYLMPRYLRAVRLLLWLWQNDPFYKKDDEFIEEHIGWANWLEDPHADKHPILDCPKCSDDLNTILERRGQEYFCSVEGQETYGCNNDPQEGIMNMLIRKGVINVTKQLTMF